MNWFLRLRKGRCDTFYVVLTRGLWIRIPQEPEFFFFFTFTIVFFLIPEWLDLIFWNQKSYLLVFCTTWQVFIHYKYLPFSDFFLRTSEQTLIKLCRNNIPMVLYKWTCFHLELSVVGSTTSKLGEERLSSFTNYFFRTSESIGMI